MKAILPNGYDIETHHLHTLEDGTEIWSLKYKEFFTEENYKRGVEPTKKQFKNITQHWIFDDKKHTVSYDIQGPRNQILGTLAGEFLGVSSVGTMTFSDLLIAVFVGISSPNYTPPLVLTKPPHEKG